MADASDNFWSGRVAIVTGGASGIGRAICHRLVANGVQVAIFDTSPLSADSDAQLHLQAVDVSDQNAVRTAVEAVVARFGRLDMLVNNAGQMPASTVERMKVGEWERVLGVNLSAAFYCSQAAIPHLRRNPGSGIVMIGSINDGRRISTRGGAHYTASKLGLTGLTRQLAYELAVDGIRVNEIAPGPTFTTMGGSTVSAAAPKYIPLGQWVQPADIADAAAFLLGPQARMCTGTRLVVDGGASLTYGGSQDDYFRLRDAN